MDKIKKLKLLEDFFNSKTSESQIIIQFNELFLIVNYNKAMVYASVEGEAGSTKLDNYLKLFPENWESLNSLFYNFLNKGRKITLSELKAKKELYSLEQFKDNKNLKEKINLSFYSMTISSFKDNLYHVFFVLILFYFFLIGVIWGISLLRLTKEKIQTSEIISGSITLFIIIFIIYLIFVFYESISLLIKKKKISKIMKEIDKLPFNEFNIENVNQIVSKKTSRNFYTSFDYRILTYNDLSLELINFK